MGGQGLSTLHTPYIPTSPPPNLPLSTPIPHPNPPFHPSRSAGPMRAQPMHCCAGRLCGAAWAPAHRGPGCAMAATGIGRHGAGVGLAAATVGEQNNDGGAEPALKQGGGAARRNGPRAARVPGRQCGNGGRRGGSDSRFAPRASRAPQAALEHTAPEQGRRAWNKGDRWGTSEESLEQERRSLEWGRETRLGKCGGWVAEVVQEPLF